MGAQVGNNELQKAGVDLGAVTFLAIRLRMSICRISDRKPFVFVKKQSKQAVAAVSRRTAGGRCG